MGRWAELTLGEIARSLLRYRPAVVAVLVTVVVLRLLPDRGEHLVPVAERAGERGGAASTTTTTTTPGAAPSVSSVSSVPGDVTAGTEPPSSSDASTSFVGSDTSSGGSDSDTSFISPSSPSSSTDTTERERPLTVVEYGWATATAGTPLASSDVPDNTMPVGKRVGRDDKLSFVRLDGTAPTLVLAEASSGQRTPPAGTVGVQACQSTKADWTPGGAKTFDQAPAYDSNQCVTGTRGNDGKWRFDLGRFIFRTDRRGFVLVSTPDAAIDFQVAFDPRPAS